MNPSQPPLDENSLAGATTDQIHSALFFQLVSGHSQMAVMFLGRAPNPQTGETEAPNLEAAKLFIDQLEMIEAKTRGNLSAEESAFLRRSLTTLRLLFVDVFEAQQGAQQSGTGSPDAGTAGTAPPDEAGGGRRFTKSYGP